jgi:RNAse (barnase) inhibitor barstar
MEHPMDGTRIRSKDEFYDAVAAALSFPDWFGRNLDALYDCLPGALRVELRPR